MTAMPTTRPDPDRLADLVAVDEHARKLVGLKARKDLARFERLTRLSLSARETAAALAGALLVLGLAVAVLFVVLK